MGLCLSCHCGEAQQKAGVVAVSISHGKHSAISPAAPRPKRYSTELSKVSPRPSLELGIPHSSELFSLPSEGSDADSPTRGSIARSSTSSMTHRPSLSGRFSSVRKSCSSQVVPTETLLETRRFSSVRKSCSSQVVPAETLLETIARLEKLCDVKILNQDSSNPVVSDSTTSILLRDSCRDLALKLRMCFANEQAMEPANSESAPVTLSEVERLEAPDVDPGEPIIQNPIAVRRLPSLRSQDGDENIQFTDFEATFELLAAQMPSASQDEAAQPPPTEHLASQVQPAHRRSRTSSELSGVLLAKGVQKPKGPKNPMLLRPALTDMSANVTEPRKTPQLMKAQTVKRGSSRSLDLQNCPLSQLEFDTLFKSSQRWQSKLGAAEMSRKEASFRTEAEEPLRTAAAEDSQSIEAKDFQILAGTSSIDSEDIQTADAKESRRIEAVENPGLEDAESRGLEAAKQQGLETAAGDQGLETAADDQGLEAEDDQGLTAADDEGLEADDSQRSEAEDPQRNEAAENQGLETEDSSRTEAGADLELSLGDEQDKRSPPSADATPSQGRVSEDDDEEGEGANEDREDGASINNNRTVRVSDECLALVFENLLKLLQQSSPVELAHNTSQLLRLLAAQPSSAPPPESSAGEIQISEAATSESWHDAPVSLSTSEQLVLPVLHNTGEDLELLPECVPEVPHCDSSSNTLNSST